MSQIPTSIPEQETLNDSSQNVQELKPIPVNKIEQKQNPNIVMTMHGPVQKATWKPGSFETMLNMEFKKGLTENISVVENVQNVEKLEPRVEPPSDKELIETLYKSAAEVTRTLKASKDYSLSGNSECEFYEVDV